MVGGVLFSAAMLIRKREEEEKAAAALAAKQKAKTEELEVFAATTTPAAANLKGEEANKAAYAERKAAAATTAGVSGIWPWILVLLLLIALLYFFRGCFGCGGDNTGVAGVDKVPPKKEVVAPPVVVDTVEAIKKEPETKPAEMEKTVPLGPDAAALGFASGTTLAKTADFLANPNSNLPQTFSWTDGDYPFNSAKMSAAGKAQMDDFAKIIKAYPNTKFNFYNYLSDNENSKYTGPATDAKGLTLADVRARCPVKKIAKYGVPESRMSFEGRGKSTPLLKGNNVSGNRRGKLTEIEIVAK